MHAQRRSLHATLVWNERQRRVVRGLPLDRVSIEDMADAVAKVLGVDAPCPPSPDAHSESARPSEIVQHEQSLQRSDSITDEMRALAAGKASSTRRGKWASPPIRRLPARPASPASEQRHSQGRPPAPPSPQAFEHKYSAGAGLPGRPPAPPSPQTPEPKYSPSAGLPGRPPAPPSPQRN